MISKGRTLCVTLLLLTIFCVSSNAENDVSIVQEDIVKKITFDINKLNPQGLLGSPDNLVSVDYEFCIPADKSYAREVKKIDATVVIYEHSSGRIGCSQDEYLCIGNTNQKNFKDVLYTLSGLSYVARIDRCYWE